MELQQSASAKAAFRRIGFALLVFALTSIISQALLGLLIVYLRSRHGIDLLERSWAQWLISFAPIYFLGIPLALLVLRPLPADQTPSCRLGWKNFLLFLLMGFPLLYGGNLIGNLLSMLLSGGAAENQLEELVNNASPIKYLVLVVLAPLLEEYIFRKQLIDRTARYGEKTAVIFSAFAFGMFHMNLFQFFYAFSLGALFAYIYLRTRRLRYTVALHMIINFLGSVIAPLIASKALLAENTQITAEALSNILLPVLYGLSMIALSIAGLIVLILKAPKFVFVTAPQELPREERLKTIYGNVGMILFMLVCLIVFILALLPTE